MLFWINSGSSIADLMYRSGATGKVVMLGGGSGNAAALPGVQKVGSLSSDGKVFAYKSVGWFGGDTPLAWPLEHLGVAYIGGGNPDVGAVRIPNLRLAGEIHSAVPETPPLLMVTVADADGNLTSVDLSGRPLGPDYADSGATWLYYLNDSGERGDLVAGDNLYVTDGLSFSFDGVDPGTYILRVYATDQEGNTAVADVAVDVLP